MHVRVCASVNGWEEDAARWGVKLMMIQSERAQTISSRRSRRRRTAANRRSKTLFDNIIVL